MTVTATWAVFEEAVGETRSDPGAIVRRVVSDVDDDKATVRYEVLTTHGWEDRTPQFVWLTMEPTHGNADQLTEDEATSAIARWPGPHARHGFRRSRSPDEPQGTPIPPRPPSEGRKGRKS